MASAVATLERVATALAAGHHPRVCSYMPIGDLGRLMQARRNRALIRLTAWPFKQDRGAVHN